MIHWRRSYGDGPKFMWMVHHRQGKQSPVHFYAKYGRPMDSLVHVTPAFPTFALLKEHCELIERMLA